jgi:hypothetical protein
MHGASFNLIEGSRLRQYGVRRADCGAICDLACTAELQHVSYGMGQQPVLAS